MIQTSLWPWFFFYFGLGLVVGAVLYRSDFCMAGILRDIFLFKDYERVRHLFLAVVLTLIFFLLLRNFGLAPENNFSTGDKSFLLGGVGGIVFGFGMVLAGGCVFGTLYKMAGGNLTYWIVCGGVIVGSLLYAELHPWLRAVAENDFLVGDINLLERWPEIAGTFGWALTGILLIVFLSWWRQGRWIVDAAPDGYLQPWVTAVVLAGANLISYVRSGLPISVSTMFAKLGAWGEVILVPDHARSLDYFRYPSFVFDIDSTLYAAGGGPQFDFYAYTEGGLMLGILLGAFINALLLKEFRISSWPPRRQAISALSGGIFIALGARMANGCNIKHLLGGVPLLSLHSILFVSGLLLGAWLGAQVLPRIILR
jgi:hypothetical protein